MTNKTKITKEEQEQRRQQGNKETTNAAAKALRCLLEEDPLLKELQLTQLKFNNNSQEDPVAVVAVTSNHNGVDDDKDDDDNEDLNSNSDPAFAYAAALIYPELVIEQDDKERITTNDNIVMNIGGSKGNASVAAKNQNHLYHHHALVVPAYERKIASNKCQSNKLEACIQLTSLDPEFMPRSMESLEKCVKGSEESQYIIDTSSSSSLESTNNATTKAKKSKCFVFHSDYFRRGHADTKSSKWLKDKSTDSLRRIPCIDNDYYEPYVVLPWCPTQVLNHDSMNTQPKPWDPWAPLSPYYDERFHGYGKNKIQNIVHLQHKGYTFSVIPALGFLTHHPHPHSKAKEKWKEFREQPEDKKDNIKAEMRKLLKQYKGELIKEYKGKYKWHTKTCVPED